MKSFLQLLTESKITYNSDFKDWFGDSKCKSGNRPLVLFRGISESLEERHPSAKLGIFATLDKKVAEAYGKVTEIYMRITNPYKMSYEEIQNIKSEQQAISIKKKLINKGYDGIFLLPMDTENSYPNTISEYIAFTQDQVRKVSDFNN